MNDPITNRVVQMLVESEHLLVPLEELYERLQVEGLLSWIAPEHLEQLLLTDERFEIYEGLGDTELFHPLIQQELRVRGLLGGPLVMLHAYRASSEEVMLDVLLHLQEMNKALETAWHLRPENNPDVESELLNLLMMGDMLERELKQALQEGSLTLDFEIEENGKERGKS